jgi:tetratricopeptide (TPR) repeat protein
MKRVHLIIGSLLLVFMAIPCISLAEDNIQAISYYNSAVDMANSGDMNGALTQVDRSLAIQPNNTLALATKAGVLNALKRYEEALSVSDQAILQDRSFSYGYITRADALNGLGRYHEALAATDDAIRIDAGAPEVWATRGNALLGLGRVEDAVKASQKALELSPGNPMALDTLRRAEAIAAGADVPRQTSSKSPLPWFLAVAGAGGATILWSSKKK